METPNPLASLAGEAIQQLTMVSVNSSNLAAVGYNPATMSLDIVFNKGARYRYFGVPPTIYSGLLAAESHGKYFNANIKGVFNFEKV